jgi:hypothetical protein
MGAAFIGLGGSVWFWWFVYRPRSGAGRQEANLV